jgi:GNAT superfamily N-acetyltransferase
MGPAYGQDESAEGEETVERSDRAEPVGAVVRPATAADDLAIASLRRAWTEERGGRGPIDDPDFEPAFLAWAEDERSRRLNWLAEADGRAVGMLNLVLFTRMPRPVPEAGPAPLGQWGYIANNFVLAEFRNRGIGTLMLQAAVAYADEHDFARLVLTPTERSVPYYERSGFVPATALLVRPGRGDTLPGAPPR